MPKSFRDYLFVLIPPWQMALRYVIVLVGLVRVCYVDGFIDLTFYFFSTINDDKLDAYMYDTNF